MWTIGKYFLVFLGVFLVYFVYYNVVKAYLDRRYYSKYKNVYISPNFIPMIGDAMDFIKDFNSGKSKGYHVIERSMKISNKYDFLLFNSATL